jgi:hypothetical protein
MHPRELKKLISEWPAFSAAALYGVDINAWAFIIH